MLSEMLSSSMSSEGDRAGGQAALFGSCVGQLAARVLTLISFLWAFFVRFFLSALCFALLLPINNLLHTSRREVFFSPLCGPFSMSFVNGMLSIFEMIESSDLCACQKEEEGKGVLERSGVGVLQA